MAWSFEFLYYSRNGRKELKIRRNGICLRVERDKVRGGAMIILNFGRDWTSISVLTGHRLSP